MNEITECAGQDVMPVGRSDQRKIRQLTARVPADFHRRVLVYCALSDKTIGALLQEALMPIISPGVQLFDAKH